MFNNTMGECKTNQNITLVYKVNDPLRQSDMPRGSCVTTFKGVQANLSPKNYPSAQIDSSVIIRY